MVERAKSINGLAKIHITQHSRVPQLEGFLLDLHAYDAVKSLEEMEKGQGQEHSHVDPVRSLSPSLQAEARLNLPKSISTIALQLPTLSPSQFAALESWLRLLLWENTLLPPLPSLATTLQQTSLDSFPSSSAPDETETGVLFSIHRTKGLIRCHDGSTKMLQGVREVFEITELEHEDGERERDDEDKGGKIVMIGRGLRKNDMERSLERALREVGD